MFAKLMIRRASRALRLLDAAMMSAGMTRHERRQAMREVIAGRLDAAELLKG
jgi:hypothetical protein